jgi:hypothetical protein
VSRCLRHTARGDSAPARGSVCGRRGWRSREAGGRHQAGGRRPGGRQGHLRCRCRQERPRGTASRDRGVGRNLRAHPRAFRPRARGAARRRGPRRAHAAARSDDALDQAACGRAVRTARVELPIS